MKRLRARKLQPDERGQLWCIVATRRDLEDTGRRIDFPVVLEFVDDESGEVSPIELVVEG